jgi:DNA-binding transcriptional LysR family regulator
MNNMDWDDARYLLAIAEGGTLLAASRALRVSHPTVMRRLKRIEETLGARLFDRLPAGLAATAAGEDILVVARRIRGEFQDLERRLAGRDARPSGTLRVTTSDSLLIGLLAPLLPSFREAYPEIVLEMVSTNEVFSLTRRDADIAIRPSRNPPENLIGRRLSGLAWAVFGSEASFEGRDGRAALQDFPWVAPEEPLGGRLLQDWFTEQRLVPKIALRANSMLALAHAVAKGTGLGLLPCFLTAQLPELRRMCGPLPELEEGLWLLLHRDLQKVARIRAFLDYMAPRLAAYRPLLEGQVAPRTKLPA